MSGGFDFTRLTPIRGGFGIEIEFDDKSRTWILFLPTPLELSPQKTKFSFSFS
jgi:hypothetical protein